MVRSLDSADLFALQFLRDACLSPDGRRVAYAVSFTPDETERLEIRIVEIASGEVRELPFKGNAAWPRWSPDGKWLAFVGEGRLHVAAASTLDIGWPLTPLGASVQGAPSWSPDGTRLVVSLLERRPLSGPRRIATTQYRAEGLGFIDHLTQRLHVVSVANRELHALTAADDGLCSQPEWSPCGRRILFLGTKDAVPSSSYSPRLQTLAVESGAIDVVLDEPWFITGARWLPDGERIAVAASYDSTLTIPNPLLWVTDLSGKAEPRMAGAIGKIGGMIHHDMPSWELTRGNTIAVLDSATAFVTILVRGAYEIWRVALKGDMHVERVLTGGRSCIALTAQAATDTLLYAVTSLHSPPELYCASLLGRNERRLTSLNEEVLANWPRMQVEHFTFTSDDGLPFEAWFMSLAGSARPLPTVMFIHGGPFAATGHAFRYDFLLLASNGFGVVFANFRGSAGYGDEFTRAIMGGAGERGYPDHMGTVDAAVAKGFADPQRLGVWGPSHGGTATCWIVGHTNRFKAAVAEASVTNFTTKYYTTDAPASVARDFDGRPHEIPEVYRAASPMTYVHRCTTPTMLIHGEDDLRCPIGEAEQFFRALLDVGCPTELVRIPNCNHMGDSSGPVSARRAQNDALLRWFQRHL